MSLKLNGRMDKKKSGIIRIFQFSLREMKKSREVRCDDHLKRSTSHPCFIFFASSIKSTSLVSFRAKRVGVKRLFFLYTKALYFEYSMSCATGESMIEKELKERGREL